MNTFHIIEEDRGTITGTRHPHNGYYAGDFSAHGDIPASHAGSVTVLRTAAHPSEVWAA